MRQTTENTINAAVANIVTAAKAEVKNAATDLLIDEAQKYRTHLDNKTAFEIYLTSCGRRFIKIMRLRRRLQYKAELLEHMAGLIYDIR